MEIYQQRGQERGLFLANRWRVRRDSICCDGAYFGKLPSFRVAAREVASLADFFSDLYDALAEAWTQYRNLSLVEQDWEARWILIGLIFLGFSLFFAWKVMLPFIVLIAGAIEYLRLTRSGNSL